MPMARTDVVVEIAVAEMAEDHHAYTGEALLQHAIGLLDEPRNAGYRHRNVVLDVLAFQRLGLGDQFAQRPEGTCLRNRLRDDRVAADAGLDGAARQRLEQRTRVRRVFMVTDLHQDMLAVPLAQTASGVADSAVRPASGRSR